METRAMNGINCQCFLPRSWGNPPLLGMAIIPLDRSAMLIFI